MATPQRSDQSALLAELTGLPIETCAEFLNDFQGDFDLALQALSGVDRSAISGELNKKEFDRWSRPEPTIQDLQQINQRTGTRFTDPDFGPGPSALFSDPQRANTFMCPNCHSHASRLPSPSVLQAMNGRTDSQSLMTILRADPAIKWSDDSRPLIQCIDCKKSIPLEYLFNRVDSWIRPEEVRDELTHMTAEGMVLFRGSPESDDVSQGAIGNCWFLAALSIIAGKRPHACRKLFPYVDQNIDKTVPLNPSGAYLVQLNVHGVWRSILVDDWLPVSVRKFLVFSRPIRRQLWVPLLEKAAAKAAGCFEQLHGGTFREAFGLLTGAPTETIEIGKGVDPDLLWGQIMSWQDAEYLLGACCVPNDKISQATLNELGLHAPHGYGILHAIEFQMIEPTHPDAVPDDVRLVKIRNPWGQLGTLTWKGKWRADDPIWHRMARSSGTTCKAGQLSGLFNKQGVFLHNTISEFWLEWSDFVKYFATVEVCRLRPFACHVEASCWLPAVTGLGGAFKLSVPKSDIKKYSNVDIALYQEGAQNRHETLLADFGFVCFPESEDQPIASARRRIASESSREVCLQTGQSYFIVPLSMKNLRQTGHRKAACVVHVDGKRDTAPSSGTGIPNPKISCIPLSPELMTRAIANYLLSDDTEATVIKSNGVTLRECIDPGCGVLLTAENTNSIPVLLSVDLDFTKGMDSSRGSLLSQDVILPGERVVVQSLSIRDSDATYVRSASVAGIQAIQGSFYPPLSQEWPDMHAQRLIVGACYEGGETIDDVKNGEGSVQDRIRSLFKHYVEQGVDANEALLLAMEDLKGGSE